MKNVLLKAIEKSGNQDKIGCLSCRSLNEKDILEMQKTGIPNNEAKSLIFTYKKDIDYYQ